jgi:hypothetical protein
VQEQTKPKQTKTNNKTKQKIAQSINNGKNRSVIDGASRMLWEHALSRDRGICQKMERLKTMNNV